MHRDGKFPVLEFVFVPHAASVKRSANTKTYFLKSITSSIRTTNVQKSYIFFFSAIFFAFPAFAKCHFVIDFNVSSPFFNKILAAASSTLGPAPFGRVMPAVELNRSISSKNATRAIMDAAATDHANPLLSSKIVHFLAQFRIAL